MTTQDSQIDLAIPAREERRVNNLNPGEAVAIGLLSVGLLSAPLVLPLNVTNDLGHALCLGLFGIGFNLIFRYSGLLSFGHAAFFGFSAYATAKLLQYDPGVPLAVILLTTIAAGGCLGLVLGHVCVRRTGAYFSMTTLAIGAFVYSVAFKWNSVTGGTDGLGGFMPSHLVLLPGYEIESTDIVRVYFVVLIICAIITTLTWALMDLTPFGNTVKAVKQNEERAAFLGYHTLGVKLTNFAIGAAVAGLAGTLWAVDTAFVATDSIDLQLSTTVIIITFLGGSNWFLGPIVGSILYIILSDWLSAQTAYWQIWIGLLFIAIVLVFPSGLSGAVAFIYRGLFTKGAAL
jgi:branched-chain amino acid transport system permease protein